MRVLVVGSGGREHAICRAITASPLLTQLWCAPGNAGISTIATCLDIPVEETAALLAACRKEAIDFVIIGPEAPLALGLADELRKANIPCFGPGRKAAEIESSKGFMKDLCARANVPTAAYARFSDPNRAKAYVAEKGAPIVVKADGLAAGKGVTIAETVADAHRAIDDAMLAKAFGNAGSQIVVEEFMQGEEASFFALCDGKTAIPFAAAQDHKAAFDGDKGPNTGGMGAYSPAPVIDTAMQDRIMKEIVEPTIKALSDMGRPFTGVLFAGLMITETGPRLIEFNARFGDPETQVMLLRLRSDLLGILFAASKGKLEGIDIEWHERAALCVVMAAEGYPGPYRKGTVIRGLEKAAECENSIVLHAGTIANDKGEIVANGGRVLGVCGWGETIEAAQAHAYRAVDAIDWPEGFCRQDIGWRAIGRTKAA